jgi:hypothetical protein
MADSMAANLARSIVAVEEMDRDGTLETALDVLRHRHALNAGREDSFEVIADGTADSSRTPMTAMQTAGLEVKPFDGFDVIYGPENMRIPLPDGVATLTDWGNSPCLIGKVKHLNETYDQVIRNPEAISWVKWVFDHYGNKSWKTELKDFSEFVIRSNLKFRKKR